MVVGSIASPDQTAIACHGSLPAGGGATVTTSTDDLTAPEAARQLIDRAAGPVDVLVANLAHPPMATPLTDILDEDWATLFDVMVHPLMWLIRAAIQKAPRPQRASQTHRHGLGVGRTGSIFGLGQERLQVRPGRSIRRRLGDQRWVSWPTKISRRSPTTTPRTHEKPAHSRHTASTKTR
ncbi:MAG: SDR family NAD(P)-dependent oxidoreductase [Proteobacteria bacterium]|nr:SDR family NAD(P)-dependent oxidoreductase [Pseudomonadota bacterium]